MSARWAKQSYPYTMAVTKCSVRAYSSSHRESLFFSWVINVQRKSLQIRSFSNKQDQPLLGATFFLWQEPLVVQTTWDNAEPCLPKRTATRPSEPLRLRKLRCFFPALPVQVWSRQNQSDCLQHQRCGLLFCAQTTFAPTLSRDYYNDRFRRASVDSYNSILWGLINFNLIALIQPHKQAAREAWVDVRCCTCTHISWKFVVFVENSKNLVVYLISKRYTLASLCNLVVRRTDILFCRPENAL